jgi:hypothetical protein
MTIRQVNDAYEKLSILKQVSIYWGIWALICVLSPFNVLITMMFGALCCMVVLDIRDYFRRNPTPGNVPRDITGDRVLSLAYWAP